MNGDFNKGQFPDFSKQPSDQKGGTPPPPPPPEIGVRTMESDVKSIRETGGGSPQPYTPSEKPAEVKETAKPTIGVPGYSGPEKAVFEQPMEGAGKAEPTFTIPEPKMETPMPTPTETPAKKPSKKRLIILLSILIGVIALGVVGYFLVFPILFPAEPVIETPITTQPPIVPTEEPAPITAPAPTHASFFVTPVPQETISLSVVNASDIKSSLASLASSIEAGNFKEAVFQKPGNVLIKASEILPLLINGLTAQDFTDNFEDDFTSFVWVDNNGAWPGYILKVKQNIPLLQAQTRLAKIESANFANTFLAEPGPITKTFQNGKAKDLDTRYQTYTKAGAAINYGWLNDYLIISTSYNGLLQVVDSL